MARVTLQFEQRMSESEALMWALEADPVLRSSFAAVSFFDRPPDLGRFRDRMARATVAVPRLRQRVEEPTTGLAPPTWVDDHLFDLDHHVRRIAVPSPGTDRQVLDLAALLSGDPFDRSRPLWEFTIVEGLEGGRGAMIHRLHHTLADGEASIRLSGSFMDVERDATEPLVQGAPRRTTDEASGRSAVSAVRDTVAGAVRMPFEAARWAVSHVVTDPREAPARAGEAVETARSLLRQLAVTEPAHSPLWRERSLRRHLEVLSLPFDDVKAAAHALGGTINDFFVTGAVGAAGAYHRAMDAHVEQLRMAMPVSTRSADSGGSNAFAPTRVLVPAGTTDPVARFRAVQEVLGTTKAERSTNITAQLAGLVNVLPTPVVAKVARQQVSTVDFTTSNVRGAPFDLYVAGAKMERTHPIGPLAGTAFNLTTISVSGRLDLGCIIDPAAVVDPALLGSCLVASYDELLAAAATVA